MVAILSDFVCVFVCLCVCLFVCVFVLREVRSVGKFINGQYLQYNDKIVSSVS